LERFEIRLGNRILDPFSGTGTTVVEAKKHGISSVGIEANPMAHFASQVKLDWEVPPETLRDSAAEIGQKYREVIEKDGLNDDCCLPLFEINRNARSIPPQLRTLNSDQHKLLLANSISPLPLHKTLVLRDLINDFAKPDCTKHLLLALAKCTVFTSSNLHFGPEVGVTKPKSDAYVLEPWQEAVELMACDLGGLNRDAGVEGIVHHADSRQLNSLLERRSIDGVITSPPYPNEKDYTRTTRLESVLLGFLTDKASLRHLKVGMLRSNTRNVYKNDDDDRFVVDNVEVNRIAAAIEDRRIQLGKTSGFERMYHRVTKLYFGGMARHFSELRSLLRPGAKLAYVVGDQASYLQIMIRTGEILADIARSLGYRVLAIDLFRTRLATATRQQLREEVVVLEWPGNSH
jgi:16S rRNA G966 N2-methylase RsmD